MDYAGYNTQTGESTPVFESVENVMEYIQDTLGETLFEWECWDLNEPHRAKAALDFDCPVQVSNASYRAEGAEYCEGRSNWPDTPCHRHDED